MLKKLQNYFSIAKDLKDTYRKRITLSSQIKIKNSLLAQELEQECKKQAGVLTYAEYLKITQFGEHGYYSHSSLHGKTDIEKRWGNALAALCQKNEYDTIIEFGCGSGELGVATVKAYALQTKRHLSWIGIEIDEKIHPEIIDNFQLHSVQTSLEKIVTSIEKIPTKTNALIVFPYSLDNIPPEVFLNTHSTVSSPNAILGVIVKNKKITEILLTSEMLQEKGISLENGIFTKNNCKFDLTEWKLRKGQRAYISTDAYFTLYRCVEKYKNKANLLIIDELREEPWSFNFTNLGTPKSLYEHNLVTNQRDRYYRQSGRHNFYYPMYRFTLTKFLNALGFRSIECEIEQKKAAQLQEKSWLPIKKKYSTYSFLATNWIEKKNDILPITFSQKRII